ncbi:MAG: hypothetical protein KIT31_04260, partial [Deltaproteobacteria bacterium]|nr:hypothetical protein [Deltaproteobacteria bacterium]
MRIASLAAVVAALSAAPRLAPAQNDYGEPEYGEPEDGAAYDTAAPGEAVDDVSVFYDQLSPYGVWVDEPRLGRVFIPDTEGYVPYRDGRWEYTDVGFVWISNDPFGTITSHYGRWAYSPAYDRWVWAPDTQWGPSWVQWRESGDAFGWAPLPPEDVADVYGYAPPVYAWQFVPAPYIFSRDLRRHFLPRDRVAVIQREARPITARATIDRRSVVVGPAPDRLRQYRVAARPVRVQASSVGRFTPAEARAMSQRAHARRD